MSNYSPVYNSIWSDKKFSEYEPEKQLLFLFLITNSECKISGIYQISIKQISCSTNLERAKIKTMLSDFDKNVLEYDSKNGIIFLKNYFKYKMLNGGNPSTLRQTIIKNTELVEHDVFWIEFYKIYKEELKNKFDLLSFSPVNKVRVESGWSQGETTVEPPFINNKDNNSNNSNNTISKSDAKNINSVTVSSSKELADFLKKKLLTFKTKKLTNEEKDNLIDEYVNSLKDFRASILTEAFEVLRIKSEWFPDLGTLKNTAYERLALRLEQENPEFNNNKR